MVRSIRPVMSCLGRGGRRRISRRAAWERWPEKAEPAGAVVEGVREVKQQGGAGFEQLGAGADGGGSIWQVVEHAEAMETWIGMVSAQNRWNVLPERDAWAKPAK